MKAALVHGRRTAALAAVAVAVVAVGAGLALAAGSSSTITACAVKRTGSLRLVGRGRHCLRSEKTVRWDQTGPRGLTGARGVTRSARSDRTARDTGHLELLLENPERRTLSRLHSTADNAGQLGNVAPSGYVQNGSFFGHMTLRFLSQDVAAGDSKELYPAIPSGVLQATCSDPATSATLHYTFESGTGHVERTHAGTTV